MATAGATAAAAAQHTSSYRVKFRRKEFLGLVEIIKPSIIIEGACTSLHLRVLSCIPLSVRTAISNKKSCMPLNFQIKHGASDSKTLRIVDSDQSSFFVFRCELL
jgi:hypothetical protein